jgi:phosphoglucomutase
MDFYNNFIKWLHHPLMETDDKLSLLLMKNDKHLMEDAFYKDLDFGTGGLRSIMDVGTNRINRFTIRKATQGISNYLLSNKYLYNLKVAIAYDTRNNSRIFAFDVVGVLSANGIKAYIFEDTTPTPMLSFAVRELKCSIGIVITASHNPKEYNGYKVYGPDGSQINLDTANILINEINNVNIFDINVDSIEVAKDKRFLEFIPNSINDLYYENVKSLSMLNYEKNILIVYTPLHGSGLVPINSLLTGMGYNLFVVPEQANPDGNFPTVSSPNPEEKTALSLAVQYGKALNANIVLGTDPDTDRVGVAVNHNGTFIYLDGNQIGAILIAYIFKNKKISSKDSVIKTIVTSDLGSRIALKYGAKVFETLTGFKFIGEKIASFEENDQNNFLFGYEESYGFLMGTFVRDKDAIISSMLISEATQFYYTKGLTLIDALEELENEFGFFSTDLITFTFKGIEGQSRISKIMTKFKDLSFMRDSFSNINDIEDYSNSMIDGKNGKKQKIFLPKSDVIKYLLEGGSWFAIRPSGTEPKLKIYFSVVKFNKEDSISLLNLLKIKINSIIEEAIKN